MTLHTNQLLGRKITFFIAFCYTFFVTIAFLTPSVGIPRFTFKIPYLPVDKLAHFIIHALLLLIWVFFFWKKEKQKLKINHFIYIVSCCIFYGIIIEILQQAYVPLRQGDVLDVLANMIGTFTGLLLFFKIKSRITS
ncbi:MAG: VanZ family protein [Flavobacteriales bacterium]